MYRDHTEKTNNIKCVPPPKKKKPNNKKTNTHRELRFVSPDSSSFSFLFAFPLVQEALHHTPPGDATVARLPPADSLIHF